MSHARQVPRGKAANPAVFGVSSVHASKVLAALPENRSHHRIDSGWRGR